MVDSRTNISFHPHSSIYILPFESCIGCNLKFTLLVELVIVM